jgi:dienelactone hydrolase
VLLCWLFLLPAPCGWSGAPDDRGKSDLPRTRLDRFNLLLYHDPAGQVRPVKSLADWAERRAEAVRGMIAVTGPVPGPEKRVPLDVRVESEEDCGAFVRRFLTYAAEPGERVPAYLLLPKAALTAGVKCPAVLSLHQTHALGQKVVVGLGQSTNDEYGVELAQRGFVCLAPAYPQLANYQPDLKALGYRSGVMKAIWNNMRGLDLLESLPFVRGARFGAIGHSLGGHTAVFTAVFDPRVVIVASSCGLDAFVDYMDGNIRGWTSERYMPRLLDYSLAEIPFDFSELIGALAPRVCFISAPLGDTNFKWRSVDAIARAAAPVYELYGAPDRLRVEHPNCGHLFPTEMRTLAYRLLEQTLRSEARDH